MPFVVPTLPSRPLSPTHSYTIDWRGGLTETVSAGQVVYVYNIDDPTLANQGMFFQLGIGSPAITLTHSNTVAQYSTLTNAGTIWAYSTTQATTAVRQGIVNNSGWIIAEADVSVDGAESRLADFTAVYGILGAIHLNNTGTIYSYATGAAYGVTVQGLGTVDNSGTIFARAVQNPFGELNVAVAISGTIHDPSIHITNRAGGQIVAQGDNTSAIILYRGTFDVGDTGINNQGLIEVIPTSANGRGVAIVVGTIYEWELNEIVNSGTIRGPIAIEAVDRPGFNLPVISVDLNTTQIVHNLAGGLIEGDILLHFGDDWISNAGTIIGTVDLGSHHDLFDGRGGQVQGRVFLGEGNDQFLGGNEGVVAIGGGQADEMVGGNGADLLIGDDNADYWGGSLGNDDYLEGGAGNDGLYGGGGKDWLITRDGDVAMAGDGDDVITTDDYTFARIDGSAGFDIWQLATGSRSMDLTLVAASGRVTGIDQLDIGSGKTITIHAADLDAITDFGSLAITKGAGSTIYLPETWTAEKAVEISGHSYVPYTLGDRTLLIDADTTVVFGTPATPGLGLDAIAAGPAAPLAGSVAGTEVPFDINVNSGVYLTSDFEITAGTVFTGSNNDFAVTAFDETDQMILTNNGSIISNGAVTARGYYDGNVGTLHNNGLIRATTAGAGGAIGVAGGYAFDLFNHGTIEASATGGDATGVIIRSTRWLVATGLVNDGVITATSATGEARAIDVLYRGRFENQNTISATGGTLAIGVDFRFMTTVNRTFPNVLTNSGQIVASAMEPGGTGIAVRMNNGTIDNSGTLQGDIGVRFNQVVRGVDYFPIAATLNNSSIVEGSRAAVSAIQGTINNTGTIRGPVAVQFVQGTFDPTTSFDPATIVNSGRIEGRIALDANWYGLVIDNQAGGRIEGSIEINGALIRDDSTTMTRITNRGTIIGDIHLGLTSDLVDTVGGVIQGGVWGGQGNDTYLVDSQSHLLFEQAGEGDDTVESTVGYYLYENIENLRLTDSAGSTFGVGNASNNTITGNEGANLLIGGLGDDTLRGGFGNDLLFGEIGDDTLNGDEGIDYLVGGIGNDTLRGGADADALYGEDGDDYLDGGTSFDTDILVGGIGNDVLYAISGQENPDYDLLDGGAGDDTYWVDTGDDLTFEAVGGGIDTVHALVNVTNAGVYLWANVENLVLEGATRFGVGNELDNQITGSGGDNWLLGGLGADTINGMGGEDVLFGEGGADVFVFGANSGQDVIGDFTRGTDRIQLNGLYADFAALSANFVQVGNDGAIYLPDGNLIVLHGVTMSALTAADFIFAPVAEVLSVTDKTAAVMDRPDWIDEPPGTLYAEPLLADPAELGLSRWGDPLPGQTWAFV